MKLSEAIKIGITFRPEAHDGPFVRIANTDELRSDVWGAACEAVHSLIAKRNWDKSNELEYSKDIETLREIQQKYFADYFRMPVTCPGANPRKYSQAGGRFTGRMVGGLNEFAVEREQGKALGAITTVCPSITNLAELLEHMFYVHNWTREECAQAAEWYEQKESPLMVHNFNHYQDEAVRRQISERLTIDARRRERERHSRRQVFFTN